MSVPYRALYGDAAAAAELQSWGRLLIEEHVATITILTIMHACESRLSNT